MDARFPLLLLCLCTLFFPSPGLVLQRDTNGISMNTRRHLLSNSNGQGLAIKAQDDKEQHVNKAHNHDITSANLERGLSADTKPVNDTSSANSTDTKAKSGNNETESIGVPFPPTKSEDTQSTLKNDTKVNNASSNVEKPDGQKQNDSAPPNKKPSIQCGESHCEDPKKVVSACLRIPGDEARKLSMLVTSKADLEIMVKVVVPEYLTANPPEVSVSKGKSKTIQILMDSNFEESMLDLEAVKNKTIAVLSSYGQCEIAVPVDYFQRSAPERKPLFSSSYMQSVNPRELAYLVALILVAAIVGTWLYYKCCKKKRGGDVKYQQLEMIAPGQSTPKERDEQGTAAWDEDWDDDWEDAEAAKSSSRLSQNLSSRGLGARKNNKDGWDNSWED